MKDAAGVGRAPPLWAWLLAGIGLDAAVLCVLCPAGTAIPYQYRDVELRFEVEVMATAWLVHVAILPSLFKGGQLPTWRSGAWLVARGVGFVAIAAILAPAAGGQALRLILAFVVWIVFDLQTKLPNSLFFPMILTGSIIAGFVAGIIGNMLRPFGTQPSPRMGRLMADIGGGVIGSLLIGFSTGLIKGWIGTDPDGDPAMQAVLEGPSLPIPMGVVVLLPHLLLLGLELHRAASQSYQPVPNSKSL